MSTTNLDREIAALRRDVIAADMQLAATPEARLAVAIARGAGPAIKIYVQRAITHALDNAELQAAKILSAIIKGFA